MTEQHKTTSAKRRPGCGWLLIGCLWCAFAIWLSDRLMIGPRTDSIPATVKATLTSIEGRDVLILDTDFKGGAGPKRFLSGQIGDEGTLEVTMVRFIYVWPRLLGIEATPRVLDLESSVGDRTIRIDRVVVSTGERYEPIQANVPYTVEPRD